MKTPMTALMLLTATAANAQMLNLQDARSSNINLSLLDTQSVWHSADELRDYNNLEQSLHENITIDIAIPGSGTVSGSLAFDAYASALEISSTTYASASADVGDALPFSNAAFSNRIRFEITETTQFALDAIFEVTQHQSGGAFAIRQFGALDWIDVYAHIYTGQSGSYSDIITLNPGTYEFNAVTWASATDLIANNSEHATSYQEVSFRVVPTPPSLLALVPLTMRRRRRTR